MHYAVIYDIDSGTINRIVRDGLIRGTRIEVNGVLAAKAQDGQATTYIRDQDLSSLYTEDGVIVGRYPEDIKDMNPPAHYAQLVDADTGNAINAQVHPFCPLEEQLKILREQVKAILDKLGETSTSNFKKLEQIVDSSIATKE